MKRKFWIPIYYFILIFSSKVYSNYKNASKIFTQKNVKNKSEAISYELYRSKFFFSSSIFALKNMNAHKSSNQRFDRHIELLINKTGPSTFYDLTKSKHKKLNSSGYYFLNGYFSFLLKNYKTSSLSLKRVAKKSILSAESNFIQSYNYNQLKQFKESNSALNRCIKYSKQRKQKLIDNPKLNSNAIKYYQVLFEMCTIQKARNLFRDKKYQQAISIYNQIDNRSYRWPYIIREKAWSYFKQKNYNRTLGQLISYKFPLLQSYFNPESEYLTALSYYSLCHYDDALKVINNYNKKYKNESNHLKTKLLRHKKSHVFFFNILLKPIKKFKKVSPFMRVIMTQIRKSVRFNLELHYFKMLSSEIIAIKAMKKNKFNTLLLTKLNKLFNLRVKYLNHYIKKIFFQFIKDIETFKYYLFNLKLNILTVQRHLYQNNKSKDASYRSRGDQKNTKKQMDEKFWTFNNEFWADELGSYSFGLDNNCINKKSSNNKKKD